MSFFARLLGRQGENGAKLQGSNSTTNKRQQPCSPPSGSFAPEFAAGRSGPAQAAPVKLQNGGSTLPQSQSQHQHHQQQQQRASLESDDDDCAIRVPGSMGCPDRSTRSNSLARRRAAIDISPRAVQRLSDKVALMDAGHIDDGSTVTRTEVEVLYTDMQLIHRGRSSMVYRARELRSGRRVILKAYDSHTLGNSTRKQALERHVLTLRAAQAAAGPNCGVVLLERVVQNRDGTYLVTQACNGGTLIEAIANSGGKLPERQVAIKVALPLLSALRHLHAAGIVHRDLKPEHLMIHNGVLKIGDFGSAGCASIAAASLASSLQKQTLAALSKQRQAQQQQHQQAQSAAAAAGRGQQQQQQQAAEDHQQLDQHALLQELQQLDQQQLHLQADCTAEACSSSSCAPGVDAAAKQHQQPQQPSTRRLSDHSASRLGMVADAVTGHVSPGVSGRLSVQAVRDGMNFRIGSIEYMAPEMLNKPTAAEVFHLVIAQGIDEDDLPTYDERVDIWSCGVVLYEALSGIQPFLADSAEDMLTVIGTKMAKRLDASQQQQAAQHQAQHHHRSSHHWSCKHKLEELPAFIARLTVSADAKDFLACCLAWDPSSRLGAAELLSHPWLQRMQDEAAAVAASRATSRRISMQVSMQRARLSSDAEGTAAAAAVSAVAAAAADAAQGGHMRLPASAAAAAAACARDGPGAKDEEQQVSLVDPLVAGILQGHMDVQGYARQSSLDLMSSPLERSQTSEQLEVGARNVLRTKTQRLDARPLHAHVHAA